MGAWFHIGPRHRFRRGRGRTVEIEGVEVAVFDEKGKLFALQDACPHMGASLADGQIKDGEVICSWHHWRFDLKAGHCTSRDWKSAKSYPLEVRGEQVFIFLEQDEEKPATPPDENTEEDPMIPWDDSKYFKQ